jgi:hypothetical protein
MSTQQMNDEEQKDNSIIDNIQNQDLNNLIIPVVWSLKDREAVNESYTKLFDKLESKYHARRKRGLVCFEYYNANLDMVKPHIDYEEYMPKKEYSREVEDDIQFKLENIVEQLFGFDISEWAISYDTREITDKTLSNGKPNKHFGEVKVSFHFVLWTRKCKIPKLKQFIAENLGVFDRAGLKGIDTSIYRTGFNKFRVPMSKKSVDDEMSILIPKNYREEDEYYKHLVTATYGCIEAELKVANYQEIDNKISKVHKDVLVQAANTAEEVNAIIAKYPYISKKEGTGDYDGCTLYDLKDHHCGREHNNNHNYLIHNKYTNVLKVKCHSQRCKEFEQVIYEPPRPTLHFDVAFLNRIPVPEGCNDNYQQVKQYFEQFLIYVRDTNSYYRIRHEFNDKYNYYEKEIKGVNIDGYKKDLYFTEISEDGQPTRKNFYKRYEIDMCKKSFYNLHFQPYGPNGNNKIKNGDYNLFGGFNYNNVIDYIQKQNIPEQKESGFKFLLEHIKDYICGRARAQTEKEEEMAEKQFNYLMYYLANIVQAPTRVPQIILVLFSKTHGTGKSGFTKFISNVVGPDLSYFGSFDQITETHSHAHVAKLINVIEEVDRQTTRRNHNVIKDISQRDSAIYNEKNKPQHKIKTYVRYFMTTNYHNGVYFDDEDRRYVIYTFDKVSDIDYIKKLEDILEDPYTIYQFGKYLEDLQIPFKRTNEWIKARPLTEDYFAMMSEDSVDQFLKDFVKLESIETDHLESGDYLYDNLEKTDKDCVFVVKDTFYRKLFKPFHDDNNSGIKCKGRTTFYNYLESNYKDIISKKKFKGVKKEFFKINLRKLWLKYYKEEEFKNCHNEEMNEDESNSETLSIISESE